MRRNEADTIKTRQALLDAAQLVLREKGYAGTTLDDIAKAARVTRGAVYHHFDGKADILQSLCAERYGEFGKKLAKTAARESSAFTRLRLTILAYFDELNTNRDFADLQYILIYKTELTDEIRGGMQAKVENTRETIDQYARLIKASLQENGHHAKLTPIEIAKVLLSFQIGLANLWLADRPSVSLSEEAPRMVDAMLVSLLGERKRQ
jgi:AcrR family transcriptional regulator